MPALSRAALEASPLADLHTLASELGIDGFRRLRKAELIDKLLERSGAPDDPREPDQPRRARRTRPRRGKREADAAPDEAAGDDAGPEERAARSAGRTVEGVVELMPNGSGFVRVNPPGQSDEDVYLSAAQARRCELVGGDRVSGPVRPARRSERYDSLVRVETINGVAADDAVRETRMSDRPAEFARRALPLGGDDSLLDEVRRVAPLGLGSRCVISGPAWSGKSALLGRIEHGLRDQEGIELEVVRVGVRPEELGEDPAAGMSFAASADAQLSAIEQAVERGRRVAARGGDAVLLIDTLDALQPSQARRILAAARQLRDGGSLTIVATAARPFGGETTLIALRRGVEPTLDAEESGTLHGDRLSGDAG